MFDIIIRGGKIVDGTGGPWFPGDVGLEGDRIAAVGNLSGAEGRYEIDATGKIVCPGFVDCHSHSDRTILVNREATSSVYQGVTTEIVGNCGKGFAPLTDVNRKMMEQHILTTVRQGNAPMTSMIVEAWRIVDHDTDRRRHFKLIKRRSDLAINGIAGIPCDLPGQRPTDHLHHHKIGCHKDSQ